MWRDQKESPLKCDEIQKGRPARIRSLFPEIVNMNLLTNVNAFEHPFNLVRLLNLYFNDSSFNCLQM